MSTMLRNPFILLSVLLPGTACALTLSLQVQNETCSYANGSVSAAVSGGVPPYTYLWGGGETSNGLTALSAGTYTVTVTDFVGTQVSDQATVISENYGSYIAWTHGYCPGENYHIPFEPMPPQGLWGDFGPYSVSQGALGEVLLPDGTPNGYYYIDNGPMSPGAGFNITFWDGNGCQGTITGTAGAPVLSWPTLNVLDVQGACGNMGNGSITFSSTGNWNIDGYPILRAPGAGAYEFNNMVGSVPGTNAFIFSNLDPGDYWLMFSLALTPSLVQGRSLCAGDSVLVTVPDLGASCGMISGNTYIDANSDCVLNAGDQVVPAIVEVQPGPFYASTGGNYSVVVPNGSYTLTSTGSGIAQSCPASATVNGNSVVANIGHQATIPLDLAVGLSAGAARPGFQLQYLMTVQNQSSSASGATTTTLTFDNTVLSYISASPAPTSVVGNTITWSQPSLNYYQSRTFFINLQVPPDVGLIGTDLLANASVSSVNTDGDISNNSASAAVTITGSFDPNDKTANTSTRASNSLYFINEDEWIDYVIRFQNTGTDTAFNIVVTDTLPAALDPASIQLVCASHEHMWRLEGQGTLKFIFPNILLPDSNANEPASHGLISFRIKPHGPLSPGTVIENIANIYFDFNPPVITEPSVLTAEFSTGVVGMGVTAVVHWDNGAWVMSGLEHVEEVQLMTLDGRHLAVQRGTSDRVRLEASDLASGFYLARCSGRSGHLVTLKLLRP